MSKTSIAKYIIRMTAVFIMSIQIILGMIWMAKNIMCIPTFGDSTEYIELSKSLVLDEYRPILYPLILRIFLKIENFVHIPFQINLYLFQTAVSFISIFCSVNSIDYYMLGYGVCTWKRRRIQLFISMNLWTIPMITFMNFSVLTDSLATSVLILLLTNLIKISLEENVSVGTYFVIVITLLIESLLRADRLYSCILLLIFTFIRKMINIPKIRKKTFLSLLTISFIVVGTVHQIGHLTQIPGVYGRVETNFDFILLDRIVWPNMEKNYEFFSDEVKALISIDDAKTFDSHNNNVMYQMAPLIESKVGKQKAKKIYREMVVTVFEHSWNKVVIDIGEDIIAMVMTPVSSLLNSYNLCEKGDSWNIHCMSTTHIVLTRLYNGWYQWSFFIFIVICIGALLLNPTGTWKKHRMGVLLDIIFPYLVMSMILTLWFCLGDGAPPNDRYALIIYMSWGIVILGFLGVWENNVTKICDNSVDTN